MVGDDNPLFLDPEHGANSRYGSVIAPPFFIRQTSGPGPWPPSTQEIPSVTGRLITPGDRNIVLSTEFELLKPVKVGDRISQSQRRADVYIKPIRLDPKTFWIVTETIYRNQDNEVVLIQRNTMVRHRTPEEVKAAGDAQE
jgi:acyl dehydratase